MSEDKPKRRKRKEGEAGRVQLGDIPDKERAKMVFLRVHKMFPNLEEIHPLFQKHVIADLRLMRVEVPEGATLLSKDL